RRRHTMWPRDWSSDVCSSDLLPSFSRRTSDAAQPVDRALIERRLATALVLREKLGRAQYCRWVFGESDLLPGLVLDRYGDLVVEIGRASCRERAWVLGCGGGG